MARKRYTWTLAAFASREDHRRAEELTTLIGATIAAGRDPFDLLTHARPSRAVKTASTTTLAEFYSDWILDKTPPLVRKVQARDYRRHIEGYVLPALGDVPIAELTARDILGLRVELLKQNLVREIREEHHCL